MTPRFSQDPQEHRPKKSLSQNFLIDRNIARKIVRTAGITPGDRVLEIGAGPGALTKLLLEAGAELTAVEIDRQLCQDLQTLASQESRFHLIEGDFLTLDLSLLREKGNPWKVVANLPYHITSPTLLRLLPRFPEIATLTLMVQKEVGDRLALPPGSAIDNHLALIAQCYSSVTTCFSVPPTCFYPQPKVTSSVIQLKLHPIPLTQEEVEPFFQLTRTAFQKKRKMLRASLPPLYPREKILQALKQQGLVETTRPEELSVAEWISLFRSLYHEA